MWIRDGKNTDPGAGMEKIRIQSKQLDSIVHQCYPDPQHGPLQCVLVLMLFFNVIRHGS